MVGLWQADNGAIAIEYGLIAALIAVAILGTIAELGNTLFALPLQSIIAAFIAAIS